MTPDRGHRLVEHTADEIVEAWGPSRAACLEEAALGLVAMFAVPGRGAPTRRHDVTFAGGDAPMVLLALLDEVVYLADAEGAVPAAVRVVDDDARVRVRFDLVDAHDATPAGPAPKGVSLSGLDLHRDHSRWVARALIDV